MPTGAPRPRTRRAGRWGVTAHVHGILPTRGNDAGPRGLDGGVAGLKPPFLDYDMRTVLRSGFVALTLATSLAPPAGADMTVYYHVGSWDAFTGPGSDGRTVCGIGSTFPGDDRSLSLRFSIGGDSVMFRAKKPNWNIPLGTQIPVVLQIGLDSPWNFQGAGNGQVVEWSLDRSSMQTFDEQFRRGMSMTLSFPSGNEPPWPLALNGSTAISNAFGRCVTDLAQRTAAQQTSTTPTQPFTQEPARPPAAPGASRP